LLQRYPGNEGKKPLRLGLIIGIGKDPDATMAKVHDLGLPTCQVYVERNRKQTSRAAFAKRLTNTRLRRLLLLLADQGRKFGLLPGAADDWISSARDAGCAHGAHKEASDLQQCGIEAVQTHCGFIPEIQ